MLAALNQIYTGYQGLDRHLRVGLPSPCQASAVERLVGLAVSFVERKVVPGDAKDWEAILEKTSLSYSGQEVMTAQQLSVAQVEAALPPKGVAGSIQITDVCEEGVRAALLDLSLARLPCA